MSASPKPLLKNQQMLYLKMLIFILAGIIILAGLAGNLMSNVEQADYKLIRSEARIEIRDYPPMILAEVEVLGKRKEAISEGFQKLANYIFGNNTSQKKMKMTAPVINESSEKMAMTAPVTQEQYLDRWKVRFVIPKKYSLETVPKPNSKEVVLISLDARRFAVIRFSGFANDQSIKKHIEELKAYILVESLQPIGNPSLAFYNPPWTLPFLRRNEVMIEISR